jgi:hypothetical protein
MNLVPVAPGDLESRTARASQDLIGINEPRALLQLQAHETLSHFAVRHKLITP